MSTIPEDITTFVRNGVGKTWVNVRFDLGQGTVRLRYSRVRLEREGRMLQASHPGLECTMSIESMESVKSTGRIKRSILQAHVR